MKRTRGKAPPERGQPVTALRLQGVGSGSAFRSYSTRGVVYASTPGLRATCALATNRRLGSRTRTAACSCVDVWPGNSRLGRIIRRAETVDVRIEFTLDCSDLDRMVGFWTAAGDLVVEGVIQGRYVTLTGHGTTLTLQRVTEPKTVKNRMHLDLLVDDPEQTVRRLESLGATRLTASARQEFGQRWYVLADPEGNEFCVARDRPVAESPLDH